MSPVAREEEHYYNPPSNAREAAVMTLLYRENNIWHLVVIKRPSHPKDMHGGQISFPGGGIEDGDISYEACALRETFEEIGVPAGNISIIGQLTNLYVYASNNLVFPFVGYLEKPFDFIPDQREVERIISVPVDYFLEPSIIKKTQLNVRGYTLSSVPYFDLYGEVLWGATAMMLSEFLHLWRLAK